MWQARSVYRSPRPVRKAFVSGVRLVGGSWIMVEVLHTFV